MEKADDGIDSHSNSSSLREHEGYSVHSLDGLPQVVAQALRGGEVRGLNGLNIANYKLAISDIVVEQAEGSPTSESCASGDTHARVRQADGASWRNLQIGRRRATPKRRKSKDRQRPAAVTAIASWPGVEIRWGLAEWGLSEKMPMGFLAVELLPEPNACFAYPLGGDLGQVRVLRSSRVVSVGDTCCL